MHNTKHVILDLEKSGFHTITLTVLRQTKRMKAKLHLVVVCVIKHIQLSQFRHTLNYSLKMDTKELLGTELE